MAQSLEKLLRDLSSALGAVEVLCRIFLWRCSCLDLIWLFERTQPSSARIKLCSSIVSSRLGDGVRLEALSLRRRARRILRRRNAAPSTTLRLEELLRRLETLGASSDAVLKQHKGLVALLCGVAEDRKAERVVLAPLFRNNEENASVGGSGFNGAAEARLVEQRYAFEKRERAPEPFAQQLLPELKERLEAEQLVLRDVVFALQGIEGSYLHFNSDADRFEVDRDLPLDQGQRCLVLAMAEGGWMYRRIWNYIAARSKQPLAEAVPTGSTGAGEPPALLLCPGGLVAEAFCSAVQEHLNELFRFLAVLDSKLQAGRTSADPNPGERMTLKKLYVYLQEPLHNLSLIASLCDAVGPLKGGGILTVLHQHARHGDPTTSKFLRRVLRKCLAPLFEQLAHWLEEGELRDPHLEFFVREHGVGPELLWEEGYVFVEELFPSFLGKELGEVILKVGKGINFLRTCCGDTDFMQPEEVKGQLRILRELGNTQSEASAEFDVFDALLHGERDEIEFLVQTAAEAVNNRVKDQMLNEWGLVKHLDALKRFLLLGQGDFVEPLINAIGPELSKRASQVYRHNLTGAVDSAVRSSNAAFVYASDVLERVGVRLLEASPGDSGWDIFTLDYYVSKPLDGVINPMAQLSYRRIFHFLWRIKRVEWQLAEGWRQHMAAAHLRIEKHLPGTRALLHAASLVQGQMVHVTSNLNSYVMFEVLESEWRDVAKRIGEARDMDEMLAAHQQYIRNIFAKILLLEEETDLAELLQKVLDAIGSFCNCQNALFASAFGEIARRHASERQPKNSSTRILSSSSSFSFDGKHAQIDLVEDWELGVPYRFLDSIRSSAAVFEEALKDLIMALEENTKGAEMLKTMAYRLNFNGYYGRESVLMK